MPLRRVPAHNHAAPLPAALVRRGDRRLLRAKLPELLRRPRQPVESARAEAAEGCQWAESCNRDLGGEHHLERNAIRALNSGGDYARVPWLPVTSLVRADEL